MSFIKPHYTCRGPLQQPWWRRSSQGPARGPRVRVRGQQPRTRPQTRRSLQLTGLQDPLLRPPPGVSLPLPDSSDRLILSQCPGRGCGARDDRPGDPQPVQQWRCRVPTSLPGSHRPRVPAAGGERSSLRLLSRPRHSLPLTELEVQAGRGQTSRQPLPLLRLPRSQPRQQGQSEGDHQEAVQADQGARHGPGCALGGRLREVRGQRRLASPLHILQGRQSHPLPLRVRGGGGERGQRSGSDLAVPGEVWPRGPPQDIPRPLHSHHQSILTVFVVNLCWQLNRVTSESILNHLSAVESNTNGKCLSLLMARNLKWSCRTLFIFLIKI